MFDMFDFTPVDYDPFEDSSDPEVAARKRQASRQAPPVPRTAMPNVPSTVLSNRLPTPMMPPGMVPLPPGLPPAVRGNILTQPSYGEGEVQAPWQWSAAENALAGQPRQPEPQIADIYRLFNRHILENAPSSNAIGGNQLGNIIRGGYLYGGDEI